MLAKEKDHNSISLSPRAIFDRIVTRFFTPGWERYDSIYDHPEQLSVTFKDNPLIVVHPGFLKYWPLVDQSKIKVEAYSEYLTEVKQLVNNALENKRNVLVITPNEYVEETLELFENKKELILIPTIGNTTIIDDYILGVHSNQFFEAVSTVFSVAEVCGEQGDLCVTDVAQKLAENGIKVTLLNQAIAN